VISYNWDYWV